MQTSASVSPATLTSGSGAKLASLEGLRGILALTVCAGHLGLNNLGAQFGFQVRFDAAVDVFFAISGFVLSRAYYLERRSFRDLAVSRFARLYPLHLLTMLWCLLLSYNGGIDWTQFWQNIFLIQNVGLPPNRWAYNFPSWSISVEMAISLAFYFVMRRDRAWLPPLLLATGISMSAFATSSGLTPALNHGGVFNSGLLRGFSGFCLGAAAYLLTVHAPEACRRFSRVGSLAILALIPCFLMEAWWWLSSGVFAALIFLSVLAAASDGEMPVLSSRPFVWLGAVSYSVYLLHIPIYWTAGALFGEERLIGLAKIPLLLAVLAASAVCFRLFELPMQKLLLIWLRPRRLVPA